MDPVTKPSKYADQAAWASSLAEPVARAVEYSRRDQIPSIGTFGTAADSTWRNRVGTIIDEILADVGKESQQSLMFNPQKAPGTWKPEDAVLEAEHLSRDAVILFGLESKYSSVGSMAELGFMVAFSFLKDRRTFAFIKDADPTLGENVERARGQLASDARYLRGLAPQSFEFRQSLLDGARAALEAHQAYTKYLQSGISDKIRRQWESVTPLDSVVCISGSSKDPHSLARLQVLLGLKKNDVKFIDTVRPDWTLEKYEKEEIPQKDAALVNTVIITDSTSYGALKDIGIAVARAVIKGSYALIYLPTDLGEKKSDFDRGRSLVMAHWNRLKSEFPWVEHYVRFAASPEQLAQMAVQIVKTRGSKSGDLDTSFSPTKN